MIWGESHGLHAMRRSHTSELRQGQAHVRHLLPEQCKLLPMSAQGKALPHHPCLPLSPLAPNTDFWTSYRKAQAPCPTWPREAQGCSPEAVHRAMGCAPGWGTRALLPCCGQPWPQLLHGLASAGTLRCSRVWPVAVAAAADMLSKLQLNSQPLHCPAGTMGSVRSVSKQ